jgi:hypothetical protein
MRAIGICRFHHHDLGGGRRLRRPQQRPTGAPDIAREQHRAMAPTLVELQEDARGAQNVPGVEESGAQAGPDLDGTAIIGGSTEPSDGVERVDHRIEGRIELLGPAPQCALRVTTVLFLVEMRRIQHHEPCQLAGGLRRDDLPAEAALHQEGQPAAMVEMGMRQEHAIERCGVESERSGIVLVELATALEQPAIDQDAAAAGLDEMAGTRDAPGGAVERELHGLAGCAAA